MPQTRSVITFSKREGGMPMPHLLDIQTAAFETLLVPDDVHGARQDVSLERVFRDLFPITDVNEKYKLEFLGYALGEAKYAVEECIERDMTYAAPLKAKLRLDVYEEVEGQKRLKNAIEKEVYLGELPIMTPLGTFVINGAERVVVSQLHRSPGVVFEEDTHPNGQRLFSARIIPFRGSWVEFTIDIHDVIYVHIDKKKKFPATALLRAFGHGNNADILKLFFATKELNITGKLEGRQEKREVIGALVAEDVPNPEDPRGEPLAAVGDELTQERLNEMRHKGVKTVTVFAGYTTLDVREEEQPTTTRDRHNHVLAFDVAEPETGEVLAEAGDELTETLRKKLIKAGVHKIEVLLPHGRVGVAADQEHPGQGPDPQRGRGPGADLRPAPAGRRAQPGDRAAAAPEAVLQPQALRPGPGGPLQDQPAAQAQDRSEPHGPDRGRLHRDHPLPDRPARRARVHRRHRPSGQPPDPDRWAS